MRHASSHADRGQQGFTLVELLVVIGIITLLLAVLLPVLAKAREHAWQVVCASNQRQIAMACLAYAAQDTRGKLPLPYDAYEQPRDPRWTIKPSQAIWLVQYGIMDFSNGAGVLWAFLPGGPESRRRLFNCPANFPPEPMIRHNSDGSTTPVDTNFGYSLNYQMTATDAPGAGGPLDVGAKLSRVRHAEHKIAVMEFTYPGIIAGDPIPQPDPPRGVSLALSSRHFGRCNVAFLDGHVQLIEPSVFNGSGDWSLPNSKWSAVNEAYRHYVLYYADD